MSGLYKKPGPNAGRPSKRGQKHCQNFKIWSNFCPNYFLTLPEICSLAEIMALFLFSTLRNPSSFTQNKKKKEFEACFVLAY